jgi:hypothetical protein
LLLKVFKVVAHEKVSYRANKHSWCIVVKLDWRVVFIGFFKEFFVLRHSDNHL